MWILHFATIQLVLIQLTLKYCFASPVNCPCCEQPFQPPSQNITDLVPSPLDYSSFPIFDSVTIQNFHFITSHPLLVELHDNFCTGNYYQVYDNFVLIEDGRNILNFCGISALPVEPAIRNPTFTKVEFTLDAGEHYFTVVIFNSPIGFHLTSMMITLKPLPECPGTETTVLEMSERTINRPMSRREFRLGDYADCPCRGQS